MRTTALPRWEGARHSTALMETAYLSGAGLGRRLEAGDVRGLFRDYGYYDWRRRAGG